MTIDLLRHGATTIDGCYIGRTDVPLSEAGREAMWAAAGEPRWDRVLSSPLQRCAGFALEYAAHHHLPYREDPRLMELHFGAWEGRRVADLHERDADALGRFWSDPERFPPPGGESLGQLSARVLACIDEIRADRERLLVVTHGGAIRVLLAARDGVAADRVLTIDVPHAALLRL